MTDWTVERRAGSAAELHALTAPDPADRTVVVLTVERPAIVVGSTQDPASVAAPPGVDVARRRSGGGAVWVKPGGTLWVDVVVPRDDPLWDADVGRAAHWLGDVWAAALTAVGVAPVAVHRGPMVRTPWSAAVCFSGTGPGEVTFGEAGPKVVGISQRRTRATARFQCVAYAEWQPDPLATALAVPVAAVADAGAGLGEERLARLEAAFLTALPTT